MGRGWLGGGLSGWSWFIWEILCDLKMGGGTGKGWARMMMESLRVWSPKRGFVHSVHVHQIQPNKTNPNKQMGTMNSELNLYIFRSLIFPLTCQVNHPSNSTPASHSSTRLFDTIHFQAQVPSKGCALRMEGRQIFLLTIKSDVRIREIEVAICAGGRVHRPARRRRVR
jgi:hypothetical protein